MNVLKNIEQILRYAFSHSGPCPVCDNPEKLRVVQEAQPLVWMGQQAVMEYLQISRATFYRFKKEGILIPHKIGGRDYFLPHELDAAFQLSIRRGRI